MRPSLWLLLLALLAGALWLSWPRPPGAPVAPAVPQPAPPAAKDGPVAVLGDAPSPAQQNDSAETLAQMEQTPLNDSARALVVAALQAAQQQQFDYAAQLMEQALSEDLPDNLRAALHAMRGYYYEQQGYHDWALEQYWQALALDPAQGRAMQGILRLDPRYQAPSKPATGEND